MTPSFPAYERGNVGGGLGLGQEGEGWMETVSSVLNILV